MSYVSTQNGSAQNPARRWATLAGVAVLHAGFFYVLVTGLAGVVKMIVPPPPLTAQNDPFPIPPTPPTAHPTPKPQPTPHPLNPRRRDDSSLQPQLPPFDPPTPVPAGDGLSGESAGTEEVLATPTPTPMPSFTPRRAIPRGRAAAWITSDDYPAQDLREGNSGTTAFRLTIGNDGHVQSCTIVSSSGHPRLDAAACDLVGRRASFTPATDDTGAPTVGSYQSKVVWTIPER